MHHPADSARVEQYLSVRRRTVALCAPLAVEDTVVQSMPDASPTKWHLAHTTWFFERFALGHDGGEHPPLHPAWHYLFNSYYQGAGPMHARALRGHLSRPTLAEILAYREKLDELVASRLHSGADEPFARTVELGLQHEQQHQELMLTDIKHVFWSNPLQPVYRARERRSSCQPPPLRFIDGASGIVDTGHSGDGFAFDNETPRHRTLLLPHAIADRLVTNGEYLEFVRDDGYRDPRHWLADGWTLLQQESWSRPLYWSEDLSANFTLGGREAIDPSAPICHVSYFEADAFARWAGCRLPQEAEWENMALGLDSTGGNFADDGMLHPVAADPLSGDGPRQLFGDVWEWTASPYVPYPGFRSAAGTLGEYNGKFMNGQYVLRGGSCATPRGHVRASYRNFFPPSARWQFSGIRLAKDRP